MNKNDMRSIVYLIIALIALYYLLDEFLGKGKITNWTDQFIGDFGGVAIPAKNEDPTGGGAAETSPATNPATAPAKNTGKIKIPAPEPDPGKIKIPQPQGNQVFKPKGGAGGFNIQDVFNGFNPFPLGIPAITAEGAGALWGAIALPQVLKHSFGG